MIELEELTEQDWNRAPDYTPLPGGRIRVVRDGKRITWFRKDFDAKAIVRNLENTGYCAFHLIAFPAQSGSSLKTVKLIPGEKLASFAPPAQTVYLTIVHVDDGCNGLIVLECDDLPRG